MQATYTSRQYSPDKVRSRYVRRSANGYQFCEVGDNRRYDLRQGRVDASELPASVKAAADAMAGRAFSYVDWPL